MLLFFVVILLGASQVGTTKCSTKYTNNSYCETTCSVSESTNEPSGLEIEYCRLYYSRILVIQFTNSKYETFTLQSIFPPDIGCKYTEISITIKNSTINLMPSNAFPGKNSETYGRCSINYKKVVIDSTTFRKVDRNSVTGLPTVFSNWDILGHKIEYNPADGNVILSNKNITQVDQVFGNFPNLTTLTLASNNIESFNQSFVDIPDLKKLDLSKNRMKIIDMNSFAGLLNLEFLNLSGNQINLSNNAFNNTHNMQTINLSFNNFTEIDNKTFAGLPTLKSLNLSYNKINLINKAFKDTNSIQTLYLQKNNLTVIDYNSFTGLLSLKCMDLSNNQINSINNAFNDTKNLRKLSLSRNNLLEINYNTFSGLVNLENLDVSDNKVMFINHAFIDLQNLNTLNLSYNKIQMCDFDTFTGLSKLMVLDLSHNEIVALDKHFPVNIPKLSHFNISFNKLEYLNTDLFYELPLIKIIDINNNNFNCYQLITYTRFYLKNKIESVKGTQRNGTHFQGTLCKNETSIDQDENSMNKSNAVENVIKKLDSIDNNTNIAKEQVIILIDIVKELKKVPNLECIKNETMFFQNIVQELKNIESIEKEQQTINSLIVIMFIIHLCLVVSAVFFYNWNKIRNIFPCKQQINPVDEVEMNLNLL